MKKEYCDKCKKEGETCVVRIIDFGLFGLTFRTKSYDLCKSCTEKFREWITEDIKGDTHI